MLIKKKKIPVLQIALIGMFPSFIKRIIYKLKGYKIGKHVSFGLGSVIIGKEVVIKDNTKIGFITVIRARSIKIGRFVQIGSMTMIDTERIEIGEDTRINEQVIIGGIKTPESFIKIGKRVIIMEYSYINPTKPIIIGDDTGIGGHCLLFTHGSWLSQLDGFPVSFAPITLGKNVWLPWRVFIMPGVEVGDNVVIGANSLITKSLPSNVLAAGSPATIKVENYPPPIKEEKRNDILNQIMSDFIDHLEYNNYHVNKETFEEGFNLSIHKKKKTYKIKYINKGKLFGNIADYTLLIIDTPDFQTDNKNINMWINLRNKTRFGTSKVGEEFAKFISRYGVRFDRLD